MSLLQVIKKAAYSILMLASLLITLIFSALAARIAHLFLIGMEEPTGNGSPMAFLIGFVMEVAFAFVVLAVVALIVYGARVFTAKNKVRIAYLGAIFVLNTGVTAFVAMDIYKKSQRYLHGKLYKDDVMEDIEHRFNYRMARIDSSSFNASVEIYFENVPGCNVDTGVFKPTRPDQSKEHNGWLEGFVSMKISPENGWSMTPNPVNLDDYLFSDSTELNGMQWQALIYDKQACKVIATWTNM